MYPSTCCKMMQKVTLVWLLHIFIKTSDSAVLNALMLNSTVRNGGSIELKLVSFTLTSDETFSSLRCGPVLNAKLASLAFYDNQNKVFKIQSNLATTAPNYFGRVTASGNTVVITNVSFAEEKTFFRFALHYNRNGEPLEIVQSFQLVEVQEPPAISGTKLPNTYSILENQNLSLSCQFTSRPIASIHWEGTLSSVGKIKNSSKSTGPFLFEVMSTLSIHNVQAVHNRLQGKCIASNVAGTAQQVVMLNVTYAPKNTSMSVTPASPKEGNTIQVKCLAVSNPPIQVYDIIKGGSTVDSSTTGVYSFQSGDCAKESGVYSCVPRNSVGRDSVATTNISIYGSPKISSISPSTIVNETQNLLLTCHASGCPTPIVAWSKNGEPVSTHLGMVNITNIQPLDAGEYSCNASTRQESIVRKVTVTVNYKPRNVALMTTASGGIIKEGDQLVVNCSASGHPRVKYRISFNGTVKQDNENGVYVIAKATCASHTGTYSCVAYNEIGSASEKSVKISVEGIPSFTQKPVSKTVNESNHVSFTCKAVGCPIPKIGWRRAGNALVIKNGETLSFPKVTVADGGSYVCDANSSIASNMTSFVLTVQYKPKNASLSTTSLQAVFGMSLTVKCSASAVPTPTYRFFRKTNGTNTEVTSAQSASKGELVVSNIRHDSSYKAIFMCSASNLLGTVKSSDLAISILVPPMGIAVKPEVVTVNETDNVRIVCSVQDANPTVNFTWSRASDGSVFSSTHVLEMSRVNRTHSGDFTCAATNGVGSAVTKTAKVSVQYRPIVSPTLKTVFSACIDQTISLSCSGSGNPVPNAELHRNGELLASGKDHVRYDRKITSAGYGNYTCRVINLLGLAERIISVVKQTGPGTPNGVYVTVQSNSLTVGWKSPQCSGQNGIKFYYVYYKVASSQNFTRMQVDCKSAECEYVLKDLQAETTYDIAVAAVDGMGTEGQRQPVARPPKTGKRKSGGNDSIPIYAGAAGGVVLLVLVIVVGIIIYRGRKKAQGGVTESKLPPYANTMYSGGPTYPAKRDIENGSVDSLPSKASSAASKDTFGKKKGKSMKQNGVPPSPGFVRSHTNNSFLADSDGAYEPVSRIAGPTKTQPSNVEYAKPDKSAKAASHAPNKPKRDYAELSELSTFSPTSSLRPGTVDDYSRTNYAELDDLGPLRDASSENKEPVVGNDNYGYQVINEI